MRHKQTHNYGKFDKTVKWKNQGDQINHELQGKKYNKLDYLYEMRVFFIGQKENLSKRAILHKEQIRHED